jgi:hypothetical protein
MNRLKNYLSSRQLAEQYLNSAQSYLARNEQGAAIYNLVNAIRYLITANNNLQSLAFSVKPKKRKGAV